MSKTSKIIIVCLLVLADIFDALIVFTSPTVHTCDTGTLVAGCAGFVLMVLVTLLLCLGLFTE